jgi:septal ring factor EnvC (AmiA/AmiB activator)
MEQRIKRLEKMNRTLLCLVTVVGLACLGVAFWSFRASPTGLGLKIKQVESNMLNRLEQLTGQDSRREKEFQEREKVFQELLDVLNESEESESAATIRVYDLQKQVQKLEKMVTEKLAADKFSPLPRGS